MSVPGDDPHSSGGKEGMKLLQEALEVFARWKEAGGKESPADLLERHPRLREYLEPLLEEEEAEETPGCLGDFEILGELGRGGMGVVYEARQISLDRKVALKVLSLGPASSPATLARFRREARVAASLDHPGLVKILSFGNEGDTFFLAMELIEGASLSEILAEASRKEVSPLDGKAVGRIVASLCGVPGGEAPAWKGGYVECVLELVRQVARALDYAHEAGIVHRDVKPSNIIVRPDGRAVLTDFGLARERGDPTMTMTGDFVGTPHYVSPEQARGGGVDGRSDVFSLGAALYELLTFEKPFDGDSTHQVLGRILARDPADPHRINPDLHPDLSAVVLKALEKDPSRRYRTAGAFAADLKAFLEYRPVSARRPGPAVKTLKWAKREPWKASLALLLALALPSLGGMGIYLLRKQGEIRFAREAVKKKRVDDLLGMTFLVREEDPARADRFLARALELDPENREVRLAARLFRGKGDSGGEGEAPLPGGKASSLDFFLQSLRAGNRANRTLAGTDYGRAIQSVERAILISTRPRALYFYQLAALAFQGAQAERVPGAVGRAAREAALGLETFWPQRPASRFFLATALFPVDPARALEILDDLSFRGEEDHSFFRLRAACLVRLGRAEEALKCFREDLSRNGGDSRTAGGILNHMGFFFSRKGDRPEAVSLYRKAVEKDPECAEAWNNLGLNLVQEGKWEEAERCLKKACALRPEYLSPAMNLGLLFKKRRRYREATFWLRKALELDVENYEVRVGLAWTLGKLGKRKEAEKHYRFLLRLEPARGDAFDGMGLLRRKDPAEALYWFRSAVEREPGRGRFRLNLGTTLAILGRFREALPHLEKAAALEPGRRISHKNLVRVYKDLKNPAGARREIRRWLVREPESLWDWFTLAELHAEGALLDAGAPEGEDIRATEKAVALTKGNDPEALLFLAEILRRRGDGKGAWKLLEKSRRLLGSAGLSPSKRKRTLERLGRLEASLKGGPSHGPGPGRKGRPGGRGEQGAGVRRGAGPGKGRR